MAKLIFLHEPFAGRVYHFTTETTRVGREVQNTLVIDDKSVSAEHCEILVYGTEVIVRDQGSTNGTYVEGVRVTGQRPVQSGQRIRFGFVEARLELEPEDESDTEGATGATAAYLQKQWLCEKQPLPSGPADGR